MKRSRAVYLITAALTQLELTNSPDYDVYEPPTLEQGEKLLDIVEKAIGMIPPSTNYFIKNKPVGFEQTWEEVNDYHNWEPEDV